MNKDKVWWLTEINHESVDAPEIHRLPNNSFISEDGFKAIYFNGATCYLFEALSDETYSADGVHPFLHRGMPVKWKHQAASNGYVADCNGGAGAYSTTVVTYGASG